MLHYKTAEQQNIFNTKMENTNYFCCKNFHIYSNSFSKQMTTHSEENLSDKTMLCTFSMYTGFTPSLEVIQDLFKKT